MADQTARDVNEALWSTPQPQPTQTQQQLVGGLFMPSADVMALRNNMMLSQQTMAMQQAMQNNLQIAAYAQGMPGAMSPNSSMQDPTVANYMLQNMYQMNPYMANFLGQGGSGQGGAPQMNLVSPSYMVSPRMGVFRDQRPTSPLQTSSTAMFLRDISILGSAYPGGGMFNTIFGERQFAPYENVMEERMGAARRMYQREEAWTATAFGAASLGAAFIPGVGLPLSLAIDFGVAPVVGGLSNAYFQRRAETSRIQEISESLMTRANSGGFLGRGFSMGESAGMMQEMRRFAAKSPAYNMSDLMQVLEGGADAGLFKISASPQNTMRQLKEIIQNIDVFMQLTGDPDVKSAMDRMGRLQTMGVNVSNMQNAVGTLKTYARLAGTSVEGIFQGMGGYGAQIAAQQGASPVMGMNLGGLAQGLTNTYIQSGRITPERLGALGGEQGLAQTATQYLVNTLSQQSNYSSLLFSDYVNGEYRINPEKVREFERTGKVGGVPVGNLMAQGASTFSKLQGDQRMAFLRGRGLLANELGQSIAATPQGTRAFMKSYVSELQRVYPNIDRKNLLYNQFGEGYGLIEYMIGDEAGQDIARQQGVVQQGVEQTREQRFKTENAFWAKVGTTIATSFNDFMEKHFDFAKRGQEEQRRANEAMGIVTPLGAEAGTFGQESMNVLGGLSPRQPQSVFSRKQVGESIMRRLDDAGLEKFITYRMAKKYGALTGNKRVEDNAGELAYQFYEEAQKFKGAMSAFNEGKFDTTMTIADRRKTSESIFGDGTFHAEEFFGMSVERQATVLDYVTREKDKTTQSQMGVLNELRKNYLKILPAEVEAQTELYNKKFEDDMRKLGIAYKDQGSWSGFLALMAQKTKVTEISGADRKTAFIDFASTVLSKGEDVQLGDIQRAGAGLGLGREGATDILNAMQDFGAGLGKAFSGLALTPKQEIRNYVSDTLLKATASKSAQRFDYSNLMSGIWSTEAERKSIFQDPEQRKLFEKAYSMNLDTEKSQAALKEKMESRSAIALGALSTNAHSTGEMYTKGQFDLISDLVRIARKYESRELA